MSKPRTRQVSLALPEDLIAALDERATEEERSRSQVAAQAIRRALAADKSPASTSGNGSAVPPK